MHMQSSICKELHHYTFAVTPFFVPTFAEIMDLLGTRVGFFKQIIETISTMSKLLWSLSLF